MIVRRSLAGALLALLTTLLFVSCDEGPRYCQLLCETDADCRPRNPIAQCVDDHCVVPVCQDDEDCATPAESCLEMFSIKRCWVRCDSNGDCSQSEFCFPADDGRGTCVTDCSVTGCQGELTCNEERLCECTDDDQCFGAVCETIN